MKKGFVAYSKADSEAVGSLMVHLKGLKHKGIIETWHDRQLVPGEEWDSKIRAELEAADVIIFCVSADFLANDYIQQIEVPKAIDRHDQNEATVIPVFFRRCAWEGHTLGKIQGIPAKGKTVQDYIRDGTVDDIWTEVASAVRNAVQSRQQVPDQSLLPSADRKAGPKTWKRSTGAKPVVLSGIGQASDLQKDDFTRSTFATILDYFEASLETLKEANQGCETRLNKPSEDAFEASIYMNGKRRALCGVFIQNRMGGRGIGIGYSSNGIGDRNSFNENLSLASGERSSQLKWQALMNVMRHRTEIDSSEMDPQKAASYLWSLFVQHL